jgi:hypothetical protein
LTRNAWAAARRLLRVKFFLEKKHPAEAGCLVL